MTWEEIRDELRKGITYAGSIESVDPLRQYAEELAVVVATLTTILGKLIEEE